MLRLRVSIGLCLCGLALLILSAGADDEPPTSRLTATGTWALTIPAGKGRFPEACGEGQWPMAIVPLVGLGGKLWMVGEKSIWSSRDGIRTLLGRRGRPSIAWFLRTSCGSTAARRDAKIVGPETCGQ
jgi:hypothetical protein